MATDNRRGVRRQLERPHLRAMRTLRHRKAGCGTRRADRCRADPGAFLATVVRSLLTGDEGKLSLGLGNFVSMFDNKPFWESLATTAVMGIGATLLSCIFGLGLAWIVARTDMPGRHLFDTLNLIPFFLSPFVGAISWTYLAAPNVGLLNQGIARSVVRRILNIYTSAVSSGCSRCSTRPTSICSSSADAPDGPALEDRSSCTRRGLLADTAPRDRTSDAAGTALGRLGRVRHQRRIVRCPARARVSARNQDHTDHRIPGRAVSH